jgi:hypothetical protein
MEDFKKKLRLIGAAYEMACNSDYVCSPNEVEETHYLTDSKYTLEEYIEASKKYEGSSPAIMESIIFMLIDSIVTVKSKKCK